MENKSFRTEFQITPSAHKIDYEQKMLLVGSCFSENIGNLLGENGFRIFNNPFGILFNPVAINECIEAVISNRKIDKSEFFENNERWNHFSLHSGYSNPSLDFAVENINNNIALAHEFLKTTSTLIITLGTAWVYEKQPEGRVVANCHKLPSDNFTKRKLGAGEIISDFSYMIQHLRNFNPDIRIIFTISPVRHIKDGMVENAHSKATLNLAVHELIRRFEQAEYFPSYEIMTDDLRDYRFYADDLLHPSPMASQYIFEKFAATYFDEDAKQLFAQIEELRKAAAHRPFNKDSQAHLKFIQEQLKKLDKLTSEKNISHLDNLRQQFLTQMN